MWLVYPYTRRVYVYLNGERSPRVFEQNERFTSILGYEFEVSKFFQN